MGTCIPVQNERFPVHSSLKASQVYGLPIASFVLTSLLFYRTILILTGVVVPEGAGRAILYKERAMEGYAYQIFVF